MDRLGFDQNCERVVNSRVPGGWFYSIIEPAMIAELAVCSMRPYRPRHRFPEWLHPTPIGGAAMLPDGFRKTHLGGSVESRARPNRAWQALLQELCAARHEGVSLDGLTAYLVEFGPAARQLLGTS